MRIAFLILLTFLFACDENHFFDASADIENGSWTYSDTLAYEVQIQDTTARYDIGLRIKHNVEYAFQNLYVQIYTGFPDGKMISKTLPIDFADHTGQWYGDCTGKYCVLHVILQERAIFNQIGTHHFKIVQYMRENPVNGIEAIDFFLDKDG